MTEYLHIETYLPAGAEVHQFGNLFVYGLPPKAIVEVCDNLYHRHHLPLKMITAFDERQQTGFFKIMYLFGIPRENLFLAPFILVKEEFPSLTPLIHEASMYERKLKSFFGLTPKGHPDPRPLILHENWPENHYPLRKDYAWNMRPAEASGAFPFRKISGEGIYEIPVGPVHAGIIEPGHFRFSVAGEEILFLEPRLGYSHKGVEKLLETAPLHEKIRLSERISGDSSYSHSLTLMMALESLRGESADERTGRLRVIFCELERLANHLGDIGAIMTDAGFNFGGANGSRLREMVMQINERLTGSRFLRGVHAQTCGLSGENGVAPEAVRSLGAELEALKRDFSEVMAIAEESHSLQNRLRNTGILSPRIAREHGVIGVAGKAVGYAADARVDYPYAAYGRYPLEIALEEGGDVHARFQVRVKEVYTSIDLIKRSLTDLSGGGAFSAPSPSVGQFRKNAYVVSIVEGWRGDIVYLLSTDSNGDISRVAVRDPSFLNWTALSYAAAGNMVPDFPLINKSFSLSYSGNDL